MQITPHHSEASIIFGKGSTSSRPGSTESLVLAVDDGEVELGTWQSIVLVDPNRDNVRRRIRLSLLNG